MTEIENKVAEETQEEETEEETQEETFEGDDSTDWKAKYEEEAKKRREDGIRNRERRKALKEQLAKEKPQDKQESKELGIAEKAYLRGEGVAKEDFSFITEVMQSTGKTLDQVLETKWVLKELDERKSERASKEAIPSGNNRSSSSPKKDVNYYIDSGKTPEDKEMRLKVLNEKIRREKETKVFYNSQ